MVDRLLEVRGKTLHPSTSTPDSPNTTRKACIKLTELLMIINNNKDIYLALFKHHFTVQKIDIRVIQAYPACCFPPKSQFFNVDSERGHDSMFFISLHKTDSAVSPNLTESGGIHVEANDKNGSTL